MRCVAPLLWAAMAVLLAAGGGLLLIGCDFGKPIAFSFGGAFCPQKIDLSALTRERDRREALKSKLHEAELVLASLPDCPPPAPPPHRETEGDKARKRAQERGGKSGRLEITLSWKTKDDLDLEVQCLDQAQHWIGYLAQSTYNGMTGKGACGDGRIDLDANRKMINPISDPVENAVWTSNPPDRMYIRVMPFKRGSTAPINYLVSVKFDDEERLCPGTIYREDSSVLVLDFRKSHPLEACVAIRTKYCSRTDANCSPTPEK